MDGPCLRDLPQLVVCFVGDVVHAGACRGHVRSSSLAEKVEAILTKTHKTPSPLREACVTLGPVHLKRTPIAPPVLGPPASFRQLFLL